MFRVGQTRIFAPYMNEFLLIFLPKKNTVQLRFWPTLCVFGVTYKSIEVKAHCKGSLHSTIKKPSLVQHTTHNTTHYKGQAHSNGGSKIGK